MSAIRELSEKLHQCMKVYPLHVQTMALELRKIVLQEAPDSFELIYDSFNALSVAFSFTKNLNEAFCHIALYSHHVNLGFNYGAELNDPAGLLCGSGKTIRHIKIKKGKDIEAPHLKSFIKKAINHIQQKFPDMEKSPNGKTIIKAASENKRRPG